MMIHFLKLHIFNKRKLRRGALKANFYWELDSGNMHALNLSILVDDCIVDFTRPEKDADCLDAAHNYVLRITGFLNFIHCPNFQIVEKHNVSETGSFFALR
jgi:hypothetical protein